MQTTPNISPVKLRDAAIGSVLRVIGYEPTARDYTAFSTQVRYSNSNE